MTTSASRRGPGAWLALAALSLAGCGAPEPAPHDLPSATPAGSSPREAPELGRPRPKLLPDEAAAGVARAEREPE
ncbi:MAG: hypothetical protein M9894_34950 [Planctomycetes bacterium]|nr:hypothetical protein [Planctomycetota bacterium]